MARPVPLGGPRETAAERLAHVSQSHRVPLPLGYPNDGRPIVVEGEGHESRLTAADIGLGRVDNTHDLEKPVSAPQAAAINTAISTALAGVSDLVDIAVGDYFVLHPQTFQYDQPTAVYHWVIVHPLDHRPEVVVTDTSGAEYVGEVNWPADNIVTVDFNTPVSGRATLT